jgi:hypothetical protein
MPSGWECRPTTGTRIAHDGGIQGFNTFLGYFPGDKLVVAVLANLNGPFADQIGRNLAKVVHGEKVVLPTERKEITVSPEILKQYVSTYELTPKFSLAITLEGGQLISQGTNQEKVPMYAESETMFFLKLVDAQIEFVKNEKGEVTNLVLHQNGRDIKGVRK